jgi:hypothetical protein
MRFHFYLPSFTKSPLGSFTRHYWPSLVSPRVDGADIGMIERGGRARLLLELLDAEGVAVRSAGRTFSATFVPRRSSVTSHTSPIPPEPRGRRISQASSREPGARAIDLRGTFVVAGEVHPPLRSLARWDAKGEY